MAKTLLLKNASVLVTMDDNRREIANGAVLCRGNRIEAVGATSEFIQPADETIDLAGHVLLPGFVNTHHHMHQSLTRAVPGAQDADLFHWLKTLYPIWMGLTPEMVRVSTQVAIAELMLSGCTTSSDHLYIFPNGVRLDDSIEAAMTTGLRFHATRGAMSVGESKGGLPPDKAVQDESLIIKDMQRLVHDFHDPSECSMCRVALAPCSPFSVSRELMRDTALLARELGASMHTHLAENDEDVAYSREKFGCTPAQYAEELGWVGRDVWHAHCVKLDDDGIQRFGRTRTGIAHCPCSNMRLGSGIAPIGKMRQAGVSVGLGVDGSASNDAGHLLGEARQAMLLQRVQAGAGAMTARQAIEIATVGGAQVLNRPDIGAIKPGMAADLVAFDVGTINHAGALHDPVAALVFAAPVQVSYCIINGRVVVSNGHLTTLDLASLVPRHNALARFLVDG